MALNEYDDLLAGGTPQKDDYDAIADEAVTETKQNLKQSMWAASDKDPDRQARILELSKKTNLPPSFVESQYEDLARKHDLASMENEYDSLIAETPRLAKFLEDPEKAAVAKDDIQGLAKVEQAAKSQSFASDLSDAFAYGAINYMSGMVKAGKFTQEQQQAQKKPGQLDPRDFLYIGENKAKNRDQVIKYLDAKAEQLKPKDISESIVTNVGKGNYKTAARALSLQVAAATPQLMMIVASRGYGLSMAAGSSAGSKLDENLKAGIDPETARLNAVATGTIEAGIESLGGIGGNPLKQTLKEVIKGVGPQATKEILKESVKMVAKNAGEEGLEEFATSVSQDMVDWSMDVNKEALDGMFIRAADSFLVGAGAGGAMTSVTVAPKAIIKNSQIQMTAQATKEAYLEIGEAVEATKLKKRSPEIQAEFIESVVKDSPIQNVYVPVQDMETYFQNKGQSAVRAAQELGFLEKYNQAKEAGTDVEIPMSVWISKVAPTEHYSGLADDIKFNPAEYSVNQTKREAEAIREQMQKETEAEKTREQEKVAEQARVRESVKSQLVAAGYSPRDADRQAQLYSSFFGTMADKSGRKADELFQQYGLKIQAAQQQTAVDGQMVLNQDQLTGNPKLIENKNKLEAEGFTFSVSEDPYFDESGEEIDGPALGQDGSTFTVFAEDKTGNEIGRARFKVENGELIPDDGDGAFEAVTVDASFRRMGIATELYRLAVEATNLPVSNKNWQTESGKEFRDAIRDNKIFFQNAPTAPGPAVSPLGFFSQLDSEITKMDFKEIPAKDLLNRIKNVQGIKKEELEFTGIEEFLQMRESAPPKFGVYSDGNLLDTYDTKEMAESQIAEYWSQSPAHSNTKLEVRERDQKRVSKQEVLNFVKANGLVVEQVVLGDMPKKQIANINTSSQFGEEPQFSAPVYEEPDSSYVNDLVSDSMYEIEREIDRGQHEQYNEQLEKALEEERANLEDGEELSEDRVSEIEEEIKQKILEVEEDGQREYYESEDAGYGEYVITEEISGEELRGGTELREWTWYDRRSGRTKEYGNNEDEAKIRWVADLADAGFLKAPIDKPRPDEIEFKQNEIYWDDDAYEQAKAEFQKTDEYKEHYAKVSKKITDDTMATFEAGKRDAVDKKFWEQSAKRQIEQKMDQFVSDYLDSISSPDNPKIEYEFIVENSTLTEYDEDFALTLTGNNVNGWEIKTTYLDSDGDRRTDTTEVPAGTNLDGAKDAAQKVLSDIGYTYGYESPAADVPALDAPQKSEREILAEQFAEQNKPQSKSRFKGYSIFGKKEGSNYREILLTLPHLGPEKFLYTPHFSQENFVAHARISDVVVDGKKTLFIEEIQSDWHQQGRERGYRDEDTKKKIEEKASLKKQLGEVEQELEKFKNSLMDQAGEMSDGVSGEIDETYRQLTEKKENSEKIDGYIAKISQLEKQIEEIGEPQSAVPDAPLKQTDAWASLVMKRMIRLAAEGGYDQVSWSPASVHQERWGTDNVSWVKRDAGFKVNNEFFTTYEDAKNRADYLNSKANVDAGQKADSKVEEFGQHWLVGSAEQVGGRADGVNIEELARQRGEILEKRGQVVKTKDELREVIRETLSRERTDRSLESLVDRVWKQMESGETQSGEVRPRFEGMEFFYNKVIPDVTKKLLKKLDPEIKIAPIEIKGLEEFGGKALAFDITKKIETVAIKEGFPLFQQGDQGPRGQIQFGADRQFNISLFQSKDPSTFLHESAHFFLEVMGDLAGDANTSQDLKDDYQTILKYLKVESRDQIKAEQHEVFARTWEAYLMEGKAPSSKLRKAFATFKTWLVSVYRQVQNLDVQITPEIRSVMDRMLVAEDEAKRAQETMGYDPLFADPAAMGMNAKQQAAYIEAREEARLYAEDQIRQKLMQDHIRSEKQFYKEKRAQVEEEVLKELQQSREYKALYALQKNTMPDGSALPEGTPVLKISKSSLIAAVGAETAKTVPRGTSAKEGVHIEIVAEILGYGSGSELVAALSNLPDIKTATELKTNERMAELYPDSLNDPQISERAVQAAHSDSRAKVLRMELEYLATYEMPVLKDAIRRVARRVPTEKMVREQAAKIVAGQKISEIKPIIYQRAEIKAAKEAGQLLAKGDIDGAFEAKRRELLNHELYRAAVESKERVEKDVKNFKKLFKSDEDLAKTRDIDMVNAARSVLSLFGITRADKGPLEYLGQMRLYDNDRYLAVSALIESAIENAGPYKEIKFDDFVAMSDAVMALWDLSKSSREIEIDGIKRDREQVMQEMSDRLTELTKPGAQIGMQKAPTEWEKAKMHLMGFHSSLRRVEAWVKGVDGASKIFMKAMIQPIQDAATKYRLRKKTVVEQYLKIVEKADTKTWTGSKIAAPNLNYEFKDKSQVIGALLHTGNKSNLQKLLLGRGWGTLSEDGELDTSRWDAFLLSAHRTGLITKSDWDFVQAIWDLNESLKPDAQKAHKKMYGFYFSEITADEVSTPFGSYRGGYMPAVADKLMAQDAMIRAEKELLEKENNSFMFPTTGRGFTKSRVEAYAAPLSIDLGMVPAHIDKVLRFIEIEPTVKSLGRIVTDKGFRKTLDAYDPTAGGEMLMPWLQRVASQRVSNPSGTGWGWQGADKFFTALRSRAGLQAMTLNFTNTFQQFTGFTIAAVKVKPRYLRNALWTYVRSPRVTADAITERSDFMRSKLSVSASEMQSMIDDLITNPSKLDKAVDFAKKNGYFLQSASQNMIDVVVWSAAYDQALENGMTEADAVKDADSVVRTTQGTLNPEDISRFETGSPFMRLFTQFYSYFNMQANLLGTEYQVTMRDLGLRKGAGRLVYVYTMGFMLPAVLSELIVQAMAGKGLDADDDDEYMDDFLKVFFGSQVRSGAAMVPVAGQTMNVVVNNFNDKWYDDRISTSPSISMIESAAKAPSSVYLAIADNGDKDKAIKDSLTALGLITGLPLAPLGRPITYMGAVAEGRTEPTGPVDFARGLVTGKTGDR